MRTRDMTTKDRVAAGAAELDIVWPGWYRIVDPSTLVLASGCNCVLGQLESFEREGEAPPNASFFTSGLRRFGNWRAAMGRRAVRNTAERFGFVGVEFDDYNDLDRYWTTEIRTRRRKKKATT